MQFTSIEWNAKFTIELSRSIYNLFRICYSIYIGLKGIPKMLVALPFKTRGFSDFNDIKQKKDGRFLSRPSFYFISILPV